MNAFLLSSNRTDLRGIHAAPPGVTSLPTHSTPSGERTPVPPPSSGSGLQLSEVPLDSLPTTVQRTLEGIDRLLVYSTPMRMRFRGVTVRDGLLLRGPHGWAEAAPFWDYAPHEASVWLRSALRSALRPSPTPLRERIPVNVTIPVCSPAVTRERVLNSDGCLTAKVKVADPGVSLAEDCARVEAAAQALAEIARPLRDVSSMAGPAALRAMANLPRPRLRVDVNGAWDVDQARTALEELDRAAEAVGGLEYAEQPCATVDELARLRRSCDIPIAADESIRRAEDPLAVVRAEAADIAVVKVAPLGGVERALAIAAETGLDVVVSSAVDSSVGLAQGVALAAALPDLPYACGLATSQLLAADVCASPLLPVNGFLGVREVCPDEDLIDRVPVAQECLTRWLARLEAMCDVMGAA
ncbi:o-succinylbenzoate synthase [Schaalia sp. Marseille-Q2122]|uniref:o-succinylbenzoate synthase n=1 Tax=Schaalia sp. Marseille-Q2122 TaxID=2736604 RepID=UPI0020CA8BE6